jgi:peroxiredoxin
MASRKHLSKIDTLRHRTVELAQMAALGFVVTTGSTAAQTASDSAQPDSKQAANSRPLETKLAEMSDSFSKRADPQTLETYTAAIQNLIDSGILDLTLGVNDKAPEFELPNPANETVSLDELLQAGPVILTFYRGGWCPYCNVQLQSYQQHLDQFEAFNAQLVAITPEIPDNALSTAEKNNLEFAVLSDAHNNVADSFGLRYEIDPSIAEGFGPMLAQFNGDDSHTLPLTATYIIDTDRTIRFAKVTADYKLRAEPADLIDALAQIKDQD